MVVSVYRYGGECIQIWWWLYTYMVVSVYRYGGEWIQIWWWVRETWFYVILNNRADRTSKC